MSEQTSQTSRNYKIVPLERKNAKAAITGLRTHLAANIAVAMADNKLDKAAAYQQHLDAVEFLIWAAQGRYTGDELI